MHKIITKKSMKLCGVCGTELNVMKDFYRTSAKYYRSECKTCFCELQRERSKDHYFKNSRKYLVRNRLARKRVRDSMEEFKASRTSAECSVQHPQHRLTFDRPD